MPRKPTGSPDKIAASSSQTLSALGATTVALWSQLADLRSELAAANNRIADLEQQRDEIVSALEQQREGSHPIDPFAAQRAIESLLWIANAPLSSQPLISVVLPTFTTERAAFLRGAIESVLNQSYGNWELLVVDNCKM